MSNGGLLGVCCIVKEEYLGLINFFFFGKKEFWILNGICIKSD